MEIKRNALEWKINVIPRALESLVIMDPVAAGIDFYALCLQMDHFFRLGNGKDLFGEQQQLAINASEDILKEFRDLANDFRDYKNRGEIERFLAVWVIQNPIKNLYYRVRTEIFMKACRNKIVLKKRCN